MAAAEFLVDVRRLPVRRSPKDAAGGSRTPGFAAFRVPYTADEIGARRGECPLFLKSHSATRTTLQMCTKTFQFLTTEFIVEIMQDVNSIVAGVHSEVSRALIVRTSRFRTPRIKDYSPGYIISRFPSYRQQPSLDRVRFPGVARHPTHGLPGISRPPWPCRRGMLDLCG
jgi:hypothetical protein